MRATWKHDGSGGWVFGDWRIYVVADLKPYRLIGPERGAHYALSHAQDGGVGFFHTLADAKSYAAASEKEST
jgi:hypothetical protein